MNNVDISYLMNMLNKMDKNQLSNGLNQLNQILSPDQSSGFFSPIVPILKR